MWKIFFTYKDRSRCTVQGKGTITPELAVLQGKRCWTGCRGKESEKC